eukprot:762152-Heterocapsa_arctica.AAC.1
MVHVAFSNCSGVPVASAGRLLISDGKLRVSKSTAMPWKTCLALSMLKVSGHELQQELSLPSGW